MAENSKILLAEGRAITQWVDKRRDVPNTGAPNFEQRILETVRVGLGKTGNPLDANVTLGMLVSSGIAEIAAGAAGRPSGIPPLAPGPSIPPNDAIDLTPPPTPSGFTATAAITTIVVEHAPPTYSQGHGHGKAILYGAQRAPGAPAPTFSQAVKLAEFSGSPYAYSTNPNTVWHLWLTWVTKDGVESAQPAGGTNGVVATTGQDVRQLLDAITAAAQNPFAPFSRTAFRAGLFYIANDVTASSEPVFSVVTASFTQNGVVVPTGVYFRDGFIMNGTITNAKIANLAVDDAKISTLSVSKLKAGNVQVGEYLRSANYVSGAQGWSIAGDGGAEFSGVTVRGAVYAESGYFKGDISAATGKFKGAVMGGDFTGPAWPPPGGQGFYLGGTDGLFIGSLSNNRYFRVQANGDVFAPKFSIIGGNASFGGVLTAEAINAVSTINIAGNAITIPSTGSSPEFGFPECYVTLAQAGAVYVTSSLNWFGGSPSGGVPTATIDMQINCSSGAAGGYIIIAAAPGYAYSLTTAAVFMLAAGTYRFYASGSTTGGQHTRSGNIMAQGAMR